MVWNFYVVWVIFIFVFCFELIVFCMMDFVIWFYFLVGMDVCFFFGLGVGENWIMCLVKLKGIFKFLSDVDVFEEYIMVFFSRKICFLWLLYWMWSIRICRDWVGVFGVIVDLGLVFIVFGVDVLVLWNYDNGVKIYVYKGWVGWSYWLLSWWRNLKGLELEDCLLFIGWWLVFVCICFCWFVSGVKMELVVGVVLE